MVKNLDLKALYSRAKNIILNPDETWVRINAEPASNKNLILAYVLPFTLLAAVISFLVIWLGTYLSFSFSLKVALVELLLPVVTIVITAILANEISGMFHSAKNLTDALKLVAYSSTPWLLTNIIASLSWTLNWVMVFGLYGTYLLYEGLPAIMETTEDKKAVYTLAIVVIFFAVWLILRAVFGIERVDL